MQADFMGEIKKSNGSGGIPLDLSDVFDEIKLFEENGPGVYFLAAKENRNSILCSEYYIVDRSSPAISDEVKGYGQEIHGHPTLLLYPIDADRSGYRLVEFETVRHGAIVSGDMEKKQELHSLAQYYREFHPEYFGSYSAPISTPRGFTTRFKTLENGIFWIETAECAQLMAICYPVWESELSDYLKGIGLQTEYDQTHGIADTLGYLFFDEQDMSLAVFELLPTRQEWVKSGMIDRPALMNAIWRDHPDYAASHNLQEQLGLNDYFGLLLNALGQEVELRGSTEKMIGISPSVGCDFLHLK